MTKQRISVRDLCLVALFTALICVMAQISIPMPYGVPMTLQTFAIPFAGAVLGGKKGALATVVYVLLGTFGIPVFAGFTGGPGILFGPTGGFLLSFPIMALLAGMGAEKDNKVLMWIGLVLGSAINYLVGMLVFCLVTQNGISVAFTACVLPFLPTAAAKVVLVGLTAPKCRRLAAKSLLTA